MATVDTQSKATLTSEAFDILDCFVMGLDSVVYEIAEDIALNRRRKDDAASYNENATVQIEARDVRLAANFVVEQLKQMIQQKKLPAHVAEAVADMECCYRSRTGE